MPFAGRMRGLVEQRRSLGHPELLLMHTEGQWKRLGHTF